jgi:hypothetical protein
MATDGVTAYQIGALEPLAITDRTK